MEGLGLPKSTCSDLVIRTGFGNRVWRYVIDSKALQGALRRLYWYFLPNNEEISITRRS